MVINLCTILEIHEFGTNVDYMVIANDEFFNVDDNKSQ